MRLQRDGWSIEAGIKKKRALPQWYEDEPYIPFGSEKYIPWFWELSTERQLGMSIGPIPVSQVRLLAERKEFDDQATIVLVIIIQMLDASYMEWVQEQSSSSQTKSKPVERENIGWPRKG